MRTSTLESLDNDFGFGPRISRDKQMNVVWHDFESNDLPLVVLGYTLQHRLKSIFDFGYEDLSSILGTENDVVVHEMNVRPRVLVTLDVEGFEAGGTTDENEDWGTPVGFVNLVG